MEDYIFGIHPITQLLEKTPEEIEEVILLEGGRGKLKELHRKAREQGVLTKFRPRSYFDRLFPEKKHQGICAKKASFRYAKLEILNPAKEGEFIISCSQIHDPGNLGSLIRTAKAFGAKGLLLGERESCGITSSVVKASAGAALSMPIVRVRKLRDAYTALKEQGWWVLGMAAGGERLERFDLKRPSLFVLGSEGKGISPSISKICDATLGIQMEPGWDSLNVAVSGAIAMYEWKRQSFSIEDLSKTKL